MGLSFGNIEAAARLRMNDPAAAQQASLARMAGISYSFVPILTAQSYSQYLHAISPRAERNLDAQARILPSLFVLYAVELEEVGRFSDAAAKREALIRTIEELKAGKRLVVGLCGGGAQPRARRQLGPGARARRVRPQQSRRTGGPGACPRRTAPASSRCSTSTTSSASPTTAVSPRRGATSAPVAVARAEPRRRHGSEPAAARRRRAGGADRPPRQDPEQLWQERTDAAMAVNLQKDTDNETLFHLIWPYAKVDEFEDRARDTWRVARSKMISDEPDEETGLWRVFAFGNRQTAIDSIVLHSALQARERGKEGFTMLLSMPDEQFAYLGQLSYAQVRFVNRDEAGADAERFLPAEPVIAELSQVIPTPDAIGRGATTATGGARF
jgi:hypothetical protein